MLPIESWRMDFDGRYPIYQQIINHFSRSIAKGELCPGGRIPSIRELSVSLKVNTNTIARAYQEMERDGMIFSQRGTGYFVMNDERLVGRIKETMVDGAMTRFLEDMRALGFDSMQIISELEKKITKGGNAQ